MRLNPRAALVLGITLAVGVPAYLGFNQAWSQP